MGVIKMCVESEGGLIKHVWCGVVLKIRETNLRLID